VSNRRKPARRNGYRAEFLRSPAWFARRARWFRKQARLGRPLVCVACGRIDGMPHLELHHVDYAGVRFHDGAWRAFERHDDLWPMHPSCHELLHRLIDRDAVLAYHRTRRVASAIALSRLHAKLLAFEEVR